MVTKTVVTQEAETKPGVLTLPAAVAARRDVLGQLLSRSRVKKVLFLVGDLAAVTVAHALAETFVRGLLKVPQEYLNPPGYYVFYVPFFASLLYLLEGYKSPDLRRPEKELEVVFNGVSFSFVALGCANFVFFKTLGFSRYLLVCWYVLTLLFLLVARFGLRAMYGSLWRRERAQQKALLVGSPETLAEYRKRLAIQRYQGYEMVGVLSECDPEGASSGPAFELAVLGSLDQWEEVAAQHGVQLVLLSLPASSAGSYARVLEVARRCQGKGIDVEVYSDLFGSPEFNYERDEFSGFFRFYATSRWSRALQRFVKIALDQVIGVIGSVVTLLITPVVALLIKLEDGGPVFYRREFVGCDGEVHQYLKFRTMHEDAAEILQGNPELKAKFDQKYKLEDDPRVLRVGRFLRRYSVDEFPEFFTLLTEQMTFVGPRVISREETSRYGALLPKLLSVKPGMTGFWQVMGRQTTTYEERVQMDMFYIDHWSVWLDLVIIAKTFWKVLRPEGAY